MTDRELMQQAAEALNRSDYLGWQLNIPIIKALREKLAQQEPVAWRTFDGEGGYDYRDYDMNEDYAQEWAKRNPLHVGWVEPLYTTPPQRKPLTDEEIAKIASTPCAVVGSYVHTFARAIEAAHGIKETNRG